MSTKTTDLDMFALEQVYRPYSSMLFGVDVRFDHLSKEYQLDTVLDMFAGNPEWRDIVMDRIYRCDFQFPRYVIHPLVDYIRSYRPDLTTTTRQEKEKA